MKRHQKGTRLLLLGLCLILLGGCVDADMHVTIHKDGSGIYRLQVLTNPLVEEELNPLKEKLTEKGYQIKSLQKGEQSGWIAEKKVDNIATEPPTEDFENMTPQGKSAAALPFIEDMNKGPLKVESQLFHILIHFKTDVDLKGMVTEDPFGQAFLKKMNLRLKMTLPIAAKDHNADEVSEDGKTLTWNLKPGEVNPIKIDVELPNPIGWILVIALVTVILLILFVIWVVKRSRKKKAHR